MTTTTTKFIKARFASICPQCKVALAIGTEIGRTHDGVWRCTRCTHMFEEIGPTPKDSRGRAVPFLDRAASEARNARVLEIQNRYGLKHTFTPPEVK